MDIHDQYIYVRVTLTLTPPAGTPVGTPAGTSMAITGAIEGLMIVKAYAAVAAGVSAIITWNGRNSMITDGEDDFLNFLRRF